MNKLIKKIKIVISALMVVLLLMLVACRYNIFNSGSKTKEIEKILEQTKQQIYDMVVANDGVEDFNIYLKGDNEIVYEYEFNNDEEFPDERKENTKHVLDLQTTNYFDKFKKELELDTMILTYRYINRNKDVLFESSYDDAMIDKIKADDSLNEKIVPKSKDEIKEYLQKTKNQIHDSVMSDGNFSSFDLYLNEKNEVVYDYVFKDGSVLDKSKIDDARKKIDMMMMSSYSIIQKEIGMEDLVVVFRYLNSDGSVAIKYIYDKDVVESLKN